MPTRTRLLLLRDSLRASYWFVPSLLSVVAVLLAQACLFLDRLIPDHLLQDTPFLYAAADAERTLLLTLGTTTLSTAGVVLTLVMVPLTVAVSQFGSRLLRNFLRDGATQIVLGTYFSTFI